MAEVHTNVTIDASGNQVIIHNVGRHPLPASAGLTVTATAKVPGFPNSAVHGTVQSTGQVTPGPVIDNPGQ